MKKITVKIKQRPGAEDLAIPMYATTGASGMDLKADVEKDVIVSRGEIKLVSCGIYIELPEGYEAEIRPRSGLALKHGITLVNTPGTIDSDYRGLVNVIIINHGKDDFIIRRGARLAQMVIHEVIHAEFLKVNVLNKTCREQGGFGHTGI